MMVAPAGLENTKLLNFVSFGPTYLKITASEILVSFLLAF